MPAQAVLGVAVAAWVVTHPWAAVALGCRALAAAVVLVEGVGQAARHPPQLQGPGMVVVRLV
jgi:hypothetical protein